MCAVPLLLALLSSLSERRGCSYQAYNTPLHLAVQRGLHKVVELLLAHGADPDKTDAVRMMFSAKSCLLALLIHRCSNGAKHHSVVPSEAKHWQSCLNVSLYSEL